MSHAFHACDSFKHMTWFVCYNWLTVYCVVTHMSNLMDLILRLIMSHRGYDTRGDESPGLGLSEDAYKKGLGVDQEISRSAPSIFLPLLLTTPCRIVHDPVLPLILAPRLGFASVSTPTMAQTASSHLFTPMEDLPSATSSLADCQPEDRHLHHFLLKTTQLTGLTAEQLPVLSLSEIGDVSLADSTILPLLCSLVHAMSAMGKEMEELRLQTSDVESRVANSFPEGVDHSTQRDQIQSSLRDLSHRVAHLPPTQAPAPPPAQTSRPRPSAVPAPPGPSTRAPPQRPPKESTQSYAAIVGGTREFDKEAREVLAARNNNNSNTTRRKKNSATSTSATKVAAAAKEACPPRAHPPLASAARRFFAPRASPAPHPDATDIKAHLPDLAASVLREANCSLPRSLKAIVNDRGSVTLIVVDTSVPDAPDAPYFEALTTKLNQSFPVGPNPWLPFRLAPTSVQPPIHSLPVDYMALQDADLFNYLSDSILNSKDVTISAARILNPSRQSRMEKRAYSVVVNVEPDSVQTMLPSIYLFGNSRTVERAYSSSPLTQCQKCWKYGHVKPLCKAETPTCPLCSLQQTKAEHLCRNPSCPSWGNLKAILGCCLASLARCSNCGEAHSARSQDCPERPPPPAP